MLEWKLKNTFRREGEGRYVSENDHAQDTFPSLKENQKVP